MIEVKNEGNEVIEERLETDIGKSIQGSKLAGISSTKRQYLGNIRMDIFFYFVKNRGNEDIFNLWKSWLVVNENVFA